MKALKIIGIIIGTIIVLLLVAIIFTSPKKHLERSVVMNASPESVYEEVNTYRGFSQWSPWYAMDPEEKLTFEGPDNGPGAKVMWDGKKVGKGSQWIVASEKDKHVKNQLVFDGFKGAFYADFDLQPADGGTKVTWSYDGDYTGTGMTNSAMGKVFNWFMDGMIGTQYDQGLKALKTIVEAKPAFSEKITEENMTAVHYISEEHTMSPKNAKEVSAEMAKLHSDITGIMMKMKLQPAGAPLCAFPKFSEESMDMIYGIPVKDEVKITNPKFKLNKTPEGKAIKAVHAGSYQGLMQTHDQINKYIAYKNLTIMGAPWEVYVISPANEKDTTKWVTEVYYPVN